MALGRLDVVVEAEEVLGVVLGLDLRQAPEVAPEGGVDARAAGLVGAAGVVQVDRAVAEPPDGIPCRAHPGDPLSVVGRVVPHAVDGTMNGAARSANAVASGSTSAIAPP